MFERLTHGLRRLGLRLPSKQDLLTKRPQTAAYRPPVYQGFGTHWQQLPPFTFLTVQQMLLDPTIRLGLAMRAAPLFSLEWAWKDGPDWKPGIQAADPDVAAFVERQLRRIWATDLAAILKAQIWGWSAGEIVHKMTPGGLVEIDHLLPRHANDVRARTRDSILVGCRITRCEGNYAEAPGGAVDLDFPKCWWHAYLPEAGLHYGNSALLGAYSPWWDKWMNGGALDVRRLFMHKDAYAGADLGYPEGMQFIPGKGDVPNRDIAREIVEQVISGGVTTRPSTRDERGNEQWPLTRAQVANNPQHILKYPKDLDVEILRGLEIADDVISVDTDGTGSWAGKRVPMAAFYSGLDCWAAAVIRDLDAQAIRPLVEINFGPGQEYTIVHKPLAEQAMEQQGQGQQQGDQHPGDMADLFDGQDRPPGQRMSLRTNPGPQDPVTSAVRRVLAVRMAADGPREGNRKPAADGGELVFHEQRWRRATGFGSGDIKPDHDPAQTFEDAIRDLDSPRHANIKAVFHSVDTTLGLTSESLSVIGDWAAEGKAEASILTRYTGVLDADQLQYALAWQGKLANQKGMLGFIEETGNDCLWTIRAGWSILESRNFLDDASILSRSLIKVQDSGTLIYVVDFGKELGKNVQQLIQRGSATAQPILGNAIPVGEWQARPDARARGLQEYERIIRRYEAQYPSRNHFERSKLARMAAGSQRHVKGSLTAWAFSIPGIGGRADA